MTFPDQIVSGHRRDLHAAAMAAQTFARQVLGYLEDPCCEAITEATTDLRLALDKLPPEPISLIPALRLVGEGFRA